MLNYAMLTEQGYFVTESNSVSFDYEAIGSVYVEVIGGWVRKDGKPASTDRKMIIMLVLPERKSTEQPVL